MERLKHHAHKTLRWSEQYFKTDMVYLAKGGFWLTSLQVFSSLVSFLLTVALANLLTPTTFGTYKYILSLAGVVGTLSLTGLGTAVMQSVARGFEGSLRQGFWLNLRWSFLIILSSVLGAGYYFINGNNTLGFALLIIGVTAPILNSTTLFSYFLSGKKDFKSQSIYGAINVLLPAIATLCTILVSQNILVIILVYFLSQVIVEFSLYLLVIKKHKPNDEQIDEAMFAYSKHISAMNLLSIIAMRLDSVLVFHYLGAVALATYALAIAIPEQIRALFKNIAAVAFPKWSTRSLNEIKQTLWSKMWKLLLVLLGIMIMYILIAPILYKLFFPQYVDAIKISQIFAISLLAGGAAIIPTTILQAQKLTRELYALNLAAAITQIALLLILVPTYGLMGAIIAIILARFANFALSVLLLKQPK